MEYEIKAEDYWYWKKMMKVRDMLRVGLESEVWSEGGYTIKLGYKWLSPRRDTRVWYKKVWSHRAVPKHQLLAWMIQHNGLRVKARMFQFGVVQDPYCCLCGCQVEDIQHLFQLCVYVVQVWRAIAQWIGFQYVEGENVWEMTMPRRWPKIKWRLVNLAQMEVMYCVWEQRNKAWTDLFIERPSCVVRSIVSNLKNQVNVESSNEWSLVDKEWWSSLM